jgi:hypothetical protein
MVQDFASAQLELGVDIQQYGHCLLAAILFPTYSEVFHENRVWM